MIHETLFPQMYKCEICKATSSVQCWKPKTVNKSDNQELIATAAIEEKQEKSTNKPKKNKKKKKKTAGLIIPPLKKTQQAPAVAQQALSIAKLSSMLQSSKSPTMSKLNQFLK